MSHPRTCFNGRFCRDLSRGRPNFFEFLTKLLDFAIHGVLPLFVRLRNPPKYTAYKKRICLTLPKIILFPEIGWDELDALFSLLFGQIRRPPELACEFNEASVFFPPSLGFLGEACDYEPL